MGKKDRIKREREQGRRKPIGSRREKLSYDEQLRRDLREQIAAVIASDPDAFDPEELRSTESMFEPAPTSEPGTMYECDDCRWRGYLEGVVSTDANRSGVGGIGAAMIYGCPKCGGHMFAVEAIIMNWQEGGIAATHPAGLRPALENLLRQIESGEVTADQALEQLRKEPRFRRIIDKLEMYPVTTALVSGLIYTLLTYVAPPPQGDPPPQPATFTAEQVELIVEQVVSRVNEQEAASAPKPEKPKKPRSTPSP